MKDDIRLFGVVLLVRLRLADHGRNDIPESEHLANLVVIDLVRVLDLHFPRAHAAEIAHHGVPAVDPVEDLLKMVLASVLELLLHGEVLVIFLNFLEVEVALRLHRQIRCDVHVIVEYSKVHVLEDGKAGEELTGPAVNFCSLF